MKREHMMNSSAGMRYASSWHRSSNAGGKITRRQFVNRAAGAAALAGLGIGGLGACSGEEQGTSRAGSQEPVMIEYWHVNDETTGRPTIKDLIRKFQKANPDVTVRESYHGADGYTSLLEDLQTAQAAGSPPQVAQVGYDQLNYVANNFRFTPAEELATSYGPGDYFNNFVDNLLDLGRVDGKQAGVPYVLSVPLFLYNPTLLSEAGLDPDTTPKNWEEWERASQAVKEELNLPGICFQTTSSGTYWTQAMVESNGGDMSGCRGGQAVAAFDGPDAVEAMSFWANLADRNLALYLLEGQAGPTFLGKEVPVIVYFTSQLRSYREQANFDIGGAVFPGFGDREPRLPGGGNNLFVFSEDDAQREAAWRLVQFLTSPEGLSPWLEATGYLPTRSDVDAPGDDPIVELAQESRRFVVPWFSFPGPNGFQAGQVLHDVEEGVAGGQETNVEEALSGAAAEVNDLIEGQQCL